MRICAHGLARARFDDRERDYFVAFSCKCRGFCPSCNTRRMVETAAHLSNHVFPRCGFASGCYLCLSGCTTG